MSNVCLTKDDGLVLILPTECVVAVITLATDKEPPKERPKARSLIVTTFRGFSVHFLDMPATAAFEALADKAAAPGEWLSLPAAGDASYLNPKGVAAVEGIVLPSGELGLRVYYDRPDGGVGFTDVDLTPETLERLAVLVGGRDTGDNAPADPRPSRPRPKK